MPVPRPFERLAGSGILLGGRRAFNLAILKAQSKSTRRRKPARSRYRPRFPMGIQLGYKKQLVGIVGTFREVVLEKLAEFSPRIFPVTDSDTRSDDDAAGAIAEMIRSVTEELGRRIPDYRIEQIVRSRAADLDSFSRRDMNRVFGILLGVQPFGGESWVQETMKKFVDENVKLITDITYTTRDRIRSIVSEAVTAGTRVEQVQGQVMGAMKATESRAALIARDQVSKFNGELTQTRQKEAGVEEYIWSTSKDERVRGNPGGLYPDAIPSHWAKEGKRFRWDDPPEDTGHPGNDYQCRCIALPVIPD